MIRSKANSQVEELGDNYCLIGIYNDAQCRTEVETMEPESECMKGAINVMKDEGIKVRHIFKNMKYHYDYFN